MLKPLDRNQRHTSYSTIIVGGGMLGAVIVERLFRRSKGSGHRILVLESGPLVLKDHVRNLVPAVSLDALQGYNETPWRCDSALRVPGLIRALGGRSLTWGAWSPVPSSSELEDWPPPVAAELQSRYLPQAARLFGIEERACDCNSLQKELHCRLFRAANACRLRYIPPVETPDALAAPIARSERTGRIFSPVRLLLDLNDAADGEGSPSRLMIATQTHVERLTIENGALTAVVTDQGVVEIGAGTNVILALGAIESTRLLLSAVNNPLIGCNLRGHVLSEIICRVPRAAIPNLPDEIETALLILQGRIGGRHFHLQLSAVSIGSDASRAKDRLAREIPGVGGADLFENFSPEDVMLSIIGVGETGGEHSALALNRVRLDAGEEPGSRAEIFFQPGALDNQVWDAMEAAIDDVVAAVISRAAPRWESRRRPDLLVHEAGTLWMGADPGTSVTDLWGRVHGVENLFVSGTSLFPSVGSHNGSLAAAGLALRLADRLSSPTNATSERTSRDIYAPTSQA